MLKHKREHTWIVGLLSFLFVALFGGGAPLLERLSGGFSGILTFPLTGELAWEVRDDSSYCFTEKNINHFSGRITLIHNGSFKEQSYVCATYNDSIRYILASQADLNKKMLQKSENNGDFDKEIRIESLLVPPLSQTLLLFLSENPDTSFLLTTRQTVAKTKGRRIAAGRVFTQSEMVLWAAMLIVIGMLLSIPIFAVQRHFSPPEPEPSKPEEMRQSGTA